ncbi:endonuclease/exonuclease/phosphatase family protein [Crossiella sp. CA-258035]|uniref:endonuclease/exonuclease/phosphatase family protein n=1 Tax=Crossiella sp. CA-258035 TaxID=2981138 RepID=UPI0024BC8967|nr:endonuclease/exonuclease/phosphatase family protein [Crossiella sp. CA-258035]WHT17597.1 endonuclease/exonuclease/phosphatase family protein [Crossiella sp. CA-258035]
MTVVDVRPRRRVVAWLGWAVLAPVVGLVLVRLAGLDDGNVLALPMAGFPLVAAGTVLLAVVFGVVRMKAAWLAAGLAVVQLAVLVPRFVPDGGEVGAVRLRVGTINALAGRVDAAALVELVRAERLDVLAVQELPGAGVRSLAAAGIDEVLPYQELHPEQDTSIYSRLPLHGGGLLAAPTTWGQTVAKVEVGGRAIRLVGVHTLYPLGDAEKWGRDLAALRVAAGPDVVMLGDFNATLDHASMRGLLAAGLVDTHAELGRGWAPTWPSGWWVPPLMQLDHVLHGAGLRGVSVGEHTLGGSDHRMVVAELALV